MKNQHNIEVTVLGSSGNERYRLKVSIHDLGLHVMGMIIQKSKIEGLDWFVATPAHKATGRDNRNRYYHDVVFDQDRPLWHEVETACIKAFEEYLEISS